MSIPVTELQPGDRVILNCPKARIGAKREAIFDGLFENYTAAMTTHGAHDVDALLIERNTEAFARTEGRWARFLLQTVAAGSTAELLRPGGQRLNIAVPNDMQTRLMAVFNVDADGAAMREEEGRRIFIERRLGRAAQG